MAPSATQRPSRSPKRRTTAKKAAAAPAKKTVAAGAKKMVKTAVRPKRGSISSIGMAAARKGVKLIAKRAVEAGARAIQSATDRSAVGGKGAVEAALSRRLPIQVSIDVAVPVAVAWEEWMSWGMLTEGVHRIEDVERDGST